jgi:hypothetical protein
MNNSRVAVASYRLTKPWALGCSLALLSLLGSKMVPAHGAQQAEASRVLPARDYIYLYSTFSEVLPVGIQSRRIGRSEIRHTEVSEIAFVSNAELCFLDSVFQQQVREWAQEKDGQHQALGAHLVFTFGKKMGSSKFITADFQLAVSVLTHVRKVIDNDTTHLSNESKRCVREVLTDFIYRIDN